MRTLKIFLSSVFILGFFSSLGQSVSINNNAWLHYMGSFGITPKSGVSFETSYRHAMINNDFQQFFIRPSYDYKLKGNLVASLGYTYVLTGVYGDQAMNKRTMPENHVWLQGSMQNKVGKVALTNRLRNENRFVGLATPGSDGFEITDYTYRNRVRYMLLASLPIIKINDSKNISGFIGNEIFLNVGKNAGATLVNQNRAIAGVGYRINSGNQIQFAYIMQNIWNHPNTIKEDNNTLRVSYISSIKLYKDKAPVFTPSSRLLSFN